ncbi:MAG: CHAT domain-containing protein [Nostoc sp.]|uniref:CHAT domain-containing protein n=1 Tax=Nostoc sp. TaxID=1180 RepID=UPI002FF9F91A
MRRIANCLRNLTSKLSAALSSPAKKSRKRKKLLSITSRDFEAYEQFLLDVLEATGNSNGDEQVVYQLLGTNTDKLNDIFAELLWNWATITLPEVKPDVAESMAGVIVNFSSLVSQFPLGSKASNIEIAITGYETALTIFTRNAFPIDWAMTQYNLGAAYLDRILGERAENLELAIAAYTNVLELLITRSRCPEQWAATQCNLGNAYTKRIRKDKAENLEKGIAAYSAALEVYTRSAFPQYWATTQYNLGNAYCERILGEQAENIEQAIAAFSAALEVRTRTAFPQDWAATQCNLGSAYVKRILGEQAENIEQGIAAYSAALEVYTSNALPELWAMTQNNLARAYRNRIKGDKAENLEMVIAACNAALEVYTCRAFPQDWAITQNYLGNTYSDRIKEDKADNIEMAIAAHTAALEVFTRNGFPEEWAATQNYLGLAYLDRSRGDRAENLEIAIAAYTTALEVYTRKAFPEEWAATQNYLGLAYLDRILGERTENIEIAIAAFSTALKVYTRKAFPENWAITQNNLGWAYCDRIRGDKAENIEMAIAACNAALEVCTHISFPEMWASAQHNLGFAYFDRILGERAENIEIAIAAFTAALEVRTRTAFPQRWADTQNNLGNVYRERIRGDKAENLEIAIAACNAALEVRTRTTFPQDWAGTQMNLGNAYCERIRGDKAENIEMAIATYTAALEVSTRTAFPKDWATTQLNLGLAYNKRILGEKSENIEMAIATYTAALEIFTCKAFPQSWAGMQNNLGGAYSERIRGDKAENLELAISAYTAALEVYTCTAFAYNHAQTLFNMGIVYQEAKQFKLAYDTFAASIKTVESLWKEIFSSEEVKHKQAEDWKEYYVRMAEVCIELGKIKEAIEYVERSKTRSLVELILNRDLKTFFPQQVVTQLEQLRDEIAIGQYQLQNGKAENPKALTQHLQQLRQQRQELQDSYLPIGSGFKFDLFHATLDDKTAIIEWYVATKTIFAFVITKGQELTVWQSQSEDLKYLFDWQDKYLNDYYRQNERWQNQLEERLKKLAEILHVEKILAQIPKECDRLILIPHRFLHLLPLHALPVNELYLLDLFSNGIGYAPSCQLLQQVQLRQRLDFQSFFAIQNPTEDLFYADVEIESIQHYFSAEKTTVLRGKDANRNALDTKLANLAEVNCLHFSCHGSFNLNTPANSCLLLNGAIVNEKLDLKKCLTLGDLFNKDFNFNQCRLVVLSACETGIVDFQNSSDEYIGLPSGFLYAGSSSVVSSLWTVDDVSTAFLFIKFYENLQNYPELKQGDIAVVLNKTLTWLRNLTSEEGEQLLQQIQPYIDAMFQGQDDILKELFIDGAKNKLKSNTRPFVNPFYWAAFTAIGY